MSFAFPKEKQDRKNEPFPFTLTALRKNSNEDQSEYKERPQKVDNKAHMPKTPS